MFGNIDKSIFTNTCEVLEVVPDQRYVYPIFKNGSTSLNSMHYKKVAEQDLAQLSNIDIFVRNPHERFISGAQTYISKLDPTFDKQTALYFIKTYLYLNKHFCPQLFWLINLKKFTSAKITIRPWEEINSITPFTKNQSTVDQQVKDYFANDATVLFYNEMDEVLTVNLIGQTVTFEEILEELKIHYSELYHELFDNARGVFNVVS